MWDQEWITFKVCQGTHNNVTHQHTKRQIDTNRHAHTHTHRKRERDTYTHTNTPTEWMQINAVDVLTHLLTTASLI